MGGSRFNNSRRRKTDTNKSNNGYPLSNMPQTSAWASDEHILPGTSNGPTGKGIVVAQEISVQSEAFDDANSNDVTKHPAVNDWGYDDTKPRHP